MTESVRLQKFLAQCGIASRRRAEELIRAGRVEVDGRKITEMGAKIDPQTQTVRCDGKPVSLPDELIYVLLNKPRGYVTTLADPQGRPVVTSLLKDIPVRLFPVGRLDLDTEGALILTNDGTLAQTIQHPSHETEKTYEALVEGLPQRNGLEQLERGILLDGSQTAPSKIVVKKTFSNQTLLHITIHEGRKRQVRKMLSFIGHPVIRLKRIAYGRLFLADLPIGHYRILNPKDLKKIFL